MNTLFKVLCNRNSCNDFYSLPRNKNAIAKIPNSKFWWCLSNFCILTLYQIKGLNDGVLVHNRRLGPFEACYSVSGWVDSDNYWINKTIVSLSLHAAQVISSCISQMTKPCMQQCSTSTVIRELTLWPCWLISQKDDHDCLRFNSLSKTWQTGSDCL